MGPKGSQRDISSTASFSYEFCDSCSCQQCRTIKSVGRCSHCKCDGCVNVLPYRSGKETFNQNISDEENVSENDNLVHPITPKKRITMAKSLSTQQKKAVIDASHAAAPEFGSANPSLGFCLVSLMTDFSTLQTCHVIPKGIVGNDDNKMTRLEYAWGLGYDELNLNSRYNLINLEASLHLSFDRGQWALVPLDEVYIKKLAQLDSTFVEEIYGEERTFRYAFLPFPTLKRPIMRLNEDRLNEEMSKNNPVEVHYSPYDTLQPILKSHVKPHFVMFDLASKLQSAQLKLRKLAKGREHIDHKLLSDIETLYIKWMTKKVPSSFRGERTRTDKDNIKTTGEGGDSNEDGNGAGATKRYLTRSEVKKNSK